MSKELISSFEPDNPDSMVSDYYEVCNQLQVCIIVINKLENLKSRQNMVSTVKALTHRKEGFERQFEEQNIEYTKR